jgi:hypothetical protein
LPEFFTAAQGLGLRYYAAFGQRISYIAKTNFKGRISLGLLAQLSLEE